MKTVSISGFGGTYEWGCQRMLQLGLAWLKEHPQFDFAGAYVTFKNVYGVASPQNGSAEELDKAMMDDPMLKEYGVTGAMHQATLGHLGYIHHHGHEKWLEELKAAREPAEFFDFDGTMANIPQTKLSEEMDSRNPEEIQ